MKSRGQDGVYCGLRVTQMQEMGGMMVEECMVVLTRWMDEAVVAPLGMGFYVEGTKAGAEDGAVVAQYEYGPFGELLRASGPLARAFNFLFSTKYFDWETGLSYYGHRYYNPTTGRWLSRDPLEEQGGLNLYAFNLNDSIGRIDTDGQASIATPPGQAAVLQLEIEDLASSLNMTVQQFLARQRACAALHAAYSALVCKRCGCFTSQAEATKQSACWSTKVSLRSAFIAAKCDFVLFGSISRGSAMALKGHREELAKAIKNMVECSARAGATKY